MASKRRKHGSANVEEHPKGSGNYRVRTKINGKLITVATGLGKEQAIAVADQVGKERSAAMLREGITLSQFAPTFFEIRKKRGARSVEKDRNRWKNQVDNDEIGGIALAALRRKDVVQWRDRMTGRGLGAQTVRNALNLVRVALTEALDRELVTENAAKEVRVSKQLSAKSEEDLEGVLVPDEQSRLLEVVPEEHRPLVMVALLTGLRWAELSWLRREDIRGDHLLIRRSTGGGPTKSGKPRRVPLLGPAASALRLQLAAVPKRCPWVFPGSGGKPRVNRPNAWQQWVTDAGIDRRIRWHDLRHTCATALLAGWWTGGKRWTLDEVCSMLGHASITTTERYARKLDETLSRVAGASDFGEFPGGSLLPASAGYDSGNIAFLNRRSQVRVLPGAPAENTLDSRSAECSGGNFSGTPLDRCRDRLEALVSNPKTSSRRLRGELALVRATDAVLAGKMGLVRDRLRTATRCLDPGERKAPEVSR